MPTNKHGCCNHCKIRVKEVFPSRCNIGHIKDWNPMQEISVLTLDYLSRLSWPHTMSVVIPHPMVISTMYELDLINFLCIWSYFQFISSYLNLFSPDPDQPYNYFLWLQKVKCSGQPHCPGENIPLCTLVINACIRTKVSVTARSRMWQGLSSNVHAMEVKHTWPLNLWDRVVLLHSSAVKLIYEVSLNENLMHLHQSKQTLLSSPSSLLMQMRFAMMWFTVCIMQY